MRYKTTIFAKLDNAAYESIKLEIEEMGRSKVSLKKETAHIKFDIDAPDSVSLRATLNGITKLFTVYEKLEDLK